MNQGCVYCHSGRGCPIHSSRGDSSSSSKYYERRNTTPKLGMKRCSQCDGRSVIIRGYDGKKIQCTTCHGSGQVRGDPVLHQFIAVAPGSDICVQCGDYRSKPFHR